MWKKILCPTDFSQGARAALRVAIDMAAEAKGELVLVHTWSPPVYFMGETVGMPASVISDLVNAAEGELGKWKAEAEKLGAQRVTTRFVTGAPWHEVVAIAKDDPAIDLIVMGTHGRTGLKHVLLGSVAEKVVRHAPCAVLVVRQPS